jgi:hypothetical protein
MAAGWRLVLLLDVALIGNAWATEPNILILSGGGTPLSNRHSQYLQTKTLYDFAAREWGASSVQLFFGAGNTPETPDPLPDVFQLEPLPTDPPVSAARFIPGAIDANHAARKSEVRAFLSSVARKPMDTFFLLVSDHGMPNRESPDFVSDPFGDNCIDLWAAGAVNPKDRSLEEAPFAGRCFSKSEVEKDLNAIPARKKIFVMTQCFSGNFHRLSVRPDKDGLPAARGNVCGFTATDEGYIASGCAPDVDSQRYQGYERSMTEQITGRDVVTGIKLRDPKLNLLEAHRAAALEDLSLDIPLSSQDYYLLQWAAVLGRPDSSSLLKNRWADPPKMAKQFAQALNGPIVPAEGAEIEAYARFVDAMTARVVEKYSHFSALQNGSFKTGGTQVLDLIQTAVSENEAQRQATDSALEKTHQQFLQGLAPDFGESAFSKDEKLAFEKIQFYRKSSPSDLHAQWLIRIFEPQAFDLVSKLAATANLILNRYASTLSPERAALFAQGNALSAKTKTLRMKQADLETQEKLLERIFDYRRALAAWRVLEANPEAQALQDLSALQSCLNETLRGNL